MRVLLDECLPRPLAQDLTGHDVQTVPQAGWAGKANGELLKLAEGSFDAFITIDQGLEYEQNLANINVGIIALSAKSNRLADLRLLVPQILSALESLKPGQFERLGSAG